MHFCLLKAEDSLLAITGGRQGTFTTSAEQCLGRLRSELGYARIEEIIRDGLHEFIDGFQSRLNQVGKAIAKTFFDLDPAPAARSSQFRSPGHAAQTQWQG
jgi:uncharacterized alpha-E superfamily protein